jgi:hypothetical protein
MRFIRDDSTDSVAKIKLPVEVMQMNLCLIARMQILGRQSSDDQATWSCDIVPGLAS